MFLLLNCILVTVEMYNYVIYIYSYMQLHKDWKTSSVTIWRVVSIVLFDGHSSSLRVMSMVFFCCL